MSVSVHLPRTTAAPMDPLAEISDNTLFVLGAYFFAFFPWTMMSNVDFISEKWRTVRRTRRLAWIHVVSSIFPVLYVATYAEAQRRANDSKELGAALAALMFNLFQLLRTIMGMAQLHAFVRWCKHAVQCIRALSGADEQENVDVADVADVQDKLKVNNAVVDNELGGTDTTILPSLRKMWTSVKRREFIPSAWLTTDRPGLSTVRWCGALLCGMGEDWNINKTRFKHHSDDDVEKLTSFFSSSLVNVRSCLQFVTWNIGWKNACAELFSIGQLCNANTECVDLNGEMSTAFDTDIRAYNVTEPVTAKSYKFEFEALVSSYPSSNNDTERENRENIVVELVHSVLLAKHLGVEKLKAIRKYYKNHCLPIPRMNRNAFEMLLKQHGKHPPEDSRLLNLFNSDVCQIPIFPYRMQMVALWEEASNWRVLQASAHHDIYYSLSCRGLRTPVFEREPRPASVFDLCAELASNEQFEIHQSNYFLGVVTESVRTFLAEWVTADSRTPDWKAKFSTDWFHFEVCDEVCHTLINRDSLLWVCQNTLQREVARSVRVAEDEDLRANCHLIMLFLLGFPCLDMNVDYGAEDTVVSSPGMHSSVHFNVLVWRVSTFLAPQDISVLIRVDSDARKVSLSLKNNSGNECFVWQDWVDAIMGCVKGLEGRRGGEVKENRTIVKSDLRAPALKLNSFLPYTDEQIEETKTAWVWMGWPAFDMNICKFEVEQWLAAGGIDLESFHDPRNSNPNHKLGALGEIERAKQLLEAVIAYKSDQAHL